jgi:hypothetical protein
MRKCEVEPLSAKEQEKVDKMVANGATLEGAIKSRYALRRKLRVAVVEEPVSVTIQC